MATVHRIFKQGNSQVITLPANVRHHLGCAQGDEIILNIASPSIVTLRKYCCPAPASSRASSRRPVRKTVK